MIPNHENDPDPPRRERRTPPNMPAGDALSGAHLRHARTVLGLSQTTAAAALGCSLRSLQRWEGSDELPARDAWALAAMLRSRGFHLEADYFERLAAPSWWTDPE